MSNFDECLKLVLHHEGGYVNHPKDPGGETNLGVTKRVYQEHGGTKDMKDLLVEDVAPIYKKGYWDKMKCDDIPSGLDLGNDFNFFKTLLDFLIALLYLSLT